MKKITLFILSLLSLAAVASAQMRAQNPEYLRFNPSYHFYPSGDPTGLFYHDGVYYNAWGRYYGTDLVHWHQTQVARDNAAFNARLRDPNLSAEEREQLRRSMSRSRLGGSGSIVVDEKNVAGFGKDAWLAYYHNEQQPFRTQVIGLSYSTDKGATWTR